jgi:hypothetical protein
MKPFVLWSSRSPTFLVDNWPLYDKNVCFLEKHNSSHLISKSMTLCCGRHCDVLVSTSTSKPDTRHLANARLLTVTAGLAVWSPMKKGQPWFLLHPVVGEIMTGPVSSTEKQRTWYSSWGLLWLLHKIMTSLPHDFTPNASTLNVIVTTMP